MVGNEDIAVFVAIAHECSFSRAAEKLGLAQSVVSKRLRRLEDRIGAQLIDRSVKSNVKLTRTGQLLLPVAEKTIDQVEAFDRMGRNLARGEEGPMRIGFIFSAAMNGLVPRLLFELGLELPRVRAELRMMETPQQLKALQDGELDVGFVRPRPSYPPGCGWMTALTDELLIGLSAEHPLAAGREIASSKLCGEQFVVPQFHEHVGLIASIARLGKRGGFTARDPICTEDFVTAACFAASGAAIMLAPGSLAKLNLHGLVFLPLTDFEERLKVVMVYREDGPEKAIAAARRIVAQQTHKRPQRHSKGPGGN